MSSGKNIRYLIFATYTWKSQRIYHISIATWYAVWVSFTRCACTYNITIMQVIWAWTVNPSRYGSICTSHQINTSSENMLKFPFFFFFFKCYYILFVNIFKTVCGKVIGEYVPSFKINMWNPFTKNPSPLSDVLLKAIL